MRTGTLLAFLIVFSMAAAAGAQTKISGISQCAAPEARHALEIGDQPGHVFSISKSTCTWTKPLEYNGIKSKQGVITGFDEISGNTSKTHGYYVDTMENGDKAHYRFEGTATLKDETLESAEIKWELLEGTGKLEGIEASGTCKGKGADDGGVTWECEGEYKPST